MPRPADAIFAAHKKALIGFYLGTLTMPGLIAFMPNRLMGTRLLGQYHSALTLDQWAAAA